MRAVVVAAAVAVLASGCIGRGEAPATTTPEEVSCPVPVGSTCSPGEPAPATTPRLIEAERAEWRAALGGCRDWAGVLERTLRRCTAEGI